MSQDLIQIIEWVQRYNAAITAVAAIALSFVALFLAWVGWQQAKLTRILQRAYVSAEARGIWSDMHDHLLAYVIFRNVGNLPASKLSWVIEPVEVTSKRDWQPPATRSVLVGLSILPVGGSTTVGSARISRQKIDECVGNEKFLYVWGRASYRDGFGRKRQTKFCHRYNWDARDVPVSGEIHILAKHGRYHELGNEAN
jgi:hypothetical protein